MANVAQLTSAEYTQRFNDQFSQGANAAADSAERLAQGMEVVETKARRSSSSLAALEARLDSGARLAQAKAREDEKLARATEQLNAAVARGAITQERANQLTTLAAQHRDVQVASVRRQIAVEEERNRVLLGGVVAQDRFGAANDNAGRSSGRFGQALGQAGFQVQDFATQVAMGQNALMAFGVQFAQFAGIFGTAGAIAGAVVTVGVLAAQFLTGADAAKALNDAIKSQDEIYKAATEAADRYRAGLEDEAQTILRLRDLYASYSAARRQAEEFRLMDRQLDLENQSTALRTRAQGGLEGLSDAAANAARLGALREARGQTTEQLPQQVREAVAAVIEFRGASDASAETLARLANQLQQAGAIASDSLAPGLLEAARKIRELLPDAERLERSSEQNTRQLNALRGEASGAGDALGGARTSADALATSLDRMRRIAAANPALAVQQEALGIQQRLDALRQGGIQALEAETRAQENNRRATEASNRAREDYLRDNPRDVDGANRAAAAVLQETFHRNRLADTLDRERKAREEADREAERASQNADRRSDRITQLVDQNVDRERQRQQREEERAREQAAREEERALRERERQNEQTTNSIVSYAADRFADLWSNTGRGFAGLMQSMLQMVRQTFARIAADAIIRPIVQPIVASIMGSGGAGGAGMLGGLTQLLGLSGLGSEISRALGLGGIGSSLSGLLGAPLFGQAALSSATSSALGAMGGAYGPATAGQLGLGGLTVGNFLGGAGLGFGAGTLLNSLARGNQQNGMIGSAGGALAGAAIGSIIPGIGTVIGGLLGGAGGGLLGGLFGGGKGFSGGHVNIEVDENGQLRLGTSGSKRFDMTQTLQSAQQQVDAINARLQASGLKVTGSDRFSFVGGGQGPSADLLANAGNVVGRLQSPNANVMQALKTQTTLGGAIDAATWVSQVYDALTKINEPADAYAEQMKTINKTYDDAIAKTRELGLSEQALNDGRARAIADLEKARREQAAPAAAGMIGGLADFVSGLRFSDVSPLSPRAMFSAANDNFSALLARAQGGDFGAMSGLRGAAETLLAQGRAVEGSGAGFTALFDRVTQALGGIGALSPDDLTASVYRETQREQTEILTEQLQRLTSEVAALRQETRLNGLAPARAA